MRYLIAAGCAAVLVSVTGTGCSTTKMASMMPQFTKSKPKSDSGASKLANAPAAPQPRQATTAPSVTMPQTVASNNLPTYPGTNYPVTPHSSNAPDIAPQYQYPTTPAAPVVDPYAGYNAAAPQAPQTAPAAAPYASVPGVPSYAQQQPPASAPYAPAVTPFPQQAAPSYPQQPSTVYPQQTTPSYAQTPAYTPPASSYGNPGEPQNAANPYGSYTR